MALARRIHVEPLGVSRVGAVAFDLMDTVVRDPYREALRAGTGMEPRELFATRDLSAWPAFERGELTEREYFDTYGDIAVDVDAFHRARREGYAWIPGMRELLVDLEGRVARVAASNYPVWVEELADGMLAGLFERVLASHHLGVRKPDPAFYERLCERLDRAPDDVLFVDDREDNVRGAREMGIAAHRYVDALTLRRWIHDHGVELPRVA